MSNITVPGAPVAKGRPRFGRGRVYTPPETVAHERKVRFYAVNERIQKTDGGACLIASFFLPDRRRGNDWDNLGKLIADACNGLAYSDDSQIVEAHIYRFLDPANPRTVFSLTPVESALVVKKKAKNTSAEEVLKRPKRGSK